MKKMTLIAATFLAFGGLNAAHADGVGNPFERPPLIEPDCRILFGLLPCHEGFEYYEPEGDDDTPQMSTPPTSEPEPPKCEKPNRGDKGKGKGKGNASSNNGKGGNDGKGGKGRSDNGKGNGKGRR